MSLGNIVGKVVEEAFDLSSHIAEKAGAKKLSLVLEDFGFTAGEFASEHPIETLVGFVTATVVTTVLLPAELEAVAADFAASEAGHLVTAALTNFGTQVLGLGSTEAAGLASQAVGATSKFLVDAAVGETASEITQGLYRKVQSIFNASDSGLSISSTSSTTGIEFFDAASNVNSPNFTIDKPIGGPSIKTYDADGSSQKDAFSGPASAISSTLVDEASTTSQVTSYNADGSFNTGSYNSADGLGGKTSFVQQNANGSAQFVNQAYLFSALVHPTGSFVTPLSISKNGIIAAGVVTDKYYGFIDNGGSFTILSYPDASATHPLAINDSGTVVGSYSSQTVSNGYFIYSGGSFAEFSDSHQQLNGFIDQVSGINDKGVIVGSYRDPQNAEHGFIYRDGVFGTLDFPGSSYTRITGINNNGVVLGVYSNPTGHLDGFTDDGGVFTPIGRPGFSPTAINDAGVIVGIFGFEGQLYDHGVFVTLGIGFPEFTLLGISDDGTVVGFDGPDNSPFIATPLVLQKAGNPAGKTQVVSDGQTFNFSGAYSNDGSLQLASTSRYAVLQFLSNSQLLGGGSTLLSNSSKNAIYGPTAQDASLLIGSGQTIRGSGTIADDGDGTIINQGTIIADQSTPMNIGDGFINNGILKADGGTLRIEGNLAGHGQVIIGPSSTMEFDGAVSSGQTVNISGSNATLILHDLSGFKATIVGLNQSDTLEFGLHAASGVHVSYAPGTDITSVVLSDGDVTAATLKLQGNYSNDFFSVVAGTAFNVLAFGPYHGSNADFGRNGKSDILWQRTDGTVSIWDDGQIQLAHWIANPGTVPGSWHPAGVGDFDGNTQADILWRNDNGSVSIWDNGKIDLAHIISGPGVVANTWHISGTGDFDGNHQSDILWRNDNGSVSIWDNGKIDSAHIISGPGVVANTWHISGTGDFDGNHQSDILWRNDNGSVSIWDNGQINGAHIVSGPGVVANSWHISGTGDFDGNGHTDILWRNDNGSVSIWDNGQITGAHIIANAGVIPSGWSIAGTGDFNGNGKDDILWHRSDGLVSIWDDGQIQSAHILGQIPTDWHIV